MNYMNPKTFLTIGGIVLVIIGLAGFVGILGPTPDASIFGPTWYFTNGENWAHLIGGILALTVAYAIPPLQVSITIVVAAVTLLAGIWGFFLPSEMPNFFGANLENPLDNILHLVVGVWAALSWKGAKKTMMTQSSIGGGMSSGMGGMPM